MSLCVVNCERVSFRRRIARGIYHGISVKNDTNERLGGGEFIGKKYCIRAVKRWKSERKRRSARAGEGRRRGHTLLTLV